MRRALLNGIMGRELERDERTISGTAPAFSKLASASAPAFIFHQLIDLRASERFAREHRGRAGNLEELSRGSAG